LSSVFFPKFNNSDDIVDNKTKEEFVGKKGSQGKTQSIRFPMWMATAIEEIAENGGFTFTEVVLDLLRQELAIMGYNMGIGREMSNIIEEIKPISAAG
jgi:hypothetical protein